MEREKRKEKEKEKEKEKNERSWMKKGGGEVRVGEWWWIGGVWVGVTKWSSFVKPWNNV